MTSLLRRFSGLPSYRWASGSLILAVLLIPVLLTRLGAPNWVAILAGLPIFIALVALTILRLGDAGLSGWWIVLMILVMNFGPEWDGLPPLRIHLSHILHLVPVLLGWFVHGPRTAMTPPATPD